MKKARKRRKLKKATLKNHYNAQKCFWMFDQRTRARVCECKYACFFHLCVPEIFFDRCRHRHRCHCRWRYRSLFSTMLLMAAAVSRCYSFTRYYHFFIWLLLHFTFQQSTMKLIDSTIPIQIQL